MDKELMETGTSDKIRTMEKEVFMQWRGANRNEEAFPSSEGGNDRKVAPWRTETALLASALLEFTPEERGSYYYKNYIYEAGDHELKKLIKEVERQESALVRKEAMLEQFGYSKEEISRMDDSQFRRTLNFMECELDDRKFLASEETDPFLIESRGSQRDYMDSVISSGEVKLPSGGIKIPGFDKEYPKDYTKEYEGAFLEENKAEKRDQKKQTKEDVKAIMKLPSSKRHEYYEKVKNERGPEAAKSLVSEVKKHIRLNMEMER